MDFSEFLQPAIFGLTGKPGAGKSYFATRLIIQEITKGNNRTIITNVPINRKKLREYVKKDFNLYDLETFVDNRFFFTNRGHYNINLENPDENLDFAKYLQDDDEGVLYIIDEAHLYFNARNWKHMMGATLSFITFIRHIGDTCIYMCQKFSDIDSQFRGKTQAFHLLRNLAKEKYGIFKRGTGFRCYQYLEEDHIKNHANAKENAVQDFQYSFDIKIAECYNTSLFNKAHDKKYKVKGIPIQWLFYACGLALFAVLYWVYNGGLSSGLGYIIPDFSPKTETETVAAQAEINNLPDADPLNNPNIVQETFSEPTFYSEIPLIAFPTQDKDISNLFTAEQIEQNLKYWFGSVLKIKITFFSDKVTKEKNNAISFQGILSDFSTNKGYKASFEDGIFSFDSSFFKAFVKHIRDNSTGINIKETTILLKENVPYTLNHGFQLPYNSSVTSNGIVSQSRNYQQVGFQLDLGYEKIEEFPLLSIKIENSDVLDLSSDSPILQTFSCQNVLDITNSKTYLIADFSSRTNQQSTGFLRTQDYSNELNNKIFVTIEN